MSRLEIRLLGGFDVRYGGEPVTGFESQKVRALFAYLTVLRDRGHSRDDLMGLLWADADGDSARRSLRQSLYNLRAAFQKVGAASPISTTRQSVRMTPEVEYWLDLEAFERTRSRGIMARGADRIHHLAGAVELFRGDLLKGFAVRDAPEFENWMAGEQEKYREAAGDSLRTLVDYCLEHHEYSSGIRYARRLIDIEPLSEPAHASLIRLYSLAGKRGEAIQQFDLCRQLLDAELGVAPSEDTVSLYRLILAQKPLEEARTWEIESWAPKRPMLPFSGRQVELGQLMRWWQQRRSGCLVLLEGDSGTGKTALVDRILREIVSPPLPLVLRSRWAPFANVSGYRPAAELLHRALLDQPMRVQNALGSLDIEQLTELTRMLPEIQHLRPDLPPPSTLTREELRRRCPAHMADFLRALARAWVEDNGGPLVLFIDDLHLADATSLEVLYQLVHHLEDAPVWLLAARSPTGDDPHQERLTRRLETERRLYRTQLEPFDSATVESFASSLLGKAKKPQELAAFFERYGGARPNLLGELTQLLFEEGVLAKKGDWSWHLVAPLPTLPEDRDALLREIAVRRLRNLPTSARRLLTLAAIAGQHFDPQLLLRAADEQIEVVLANIGTWREQRLALPHRQADFTELPDESRPQAHETFEFLNSTLRQAIYDYVSEERRQVMHRDVAEALELSSSPTPGNRGSSAPVEALAYHWFRGARWHKALPYLQRAAEEALETLTPDRCVELLDLALEALAHIEESEDAPGSGRLTPEHGKLRTTLQAYRDTAQAELTALLA